MTRSRFLRLVLAACALTLPLVGANEDEYNDYNNQQEDYDENDENDDNNNNNNVVAYDDAYDGYNPYAMQNGDDYIQYWTSYHLEPKRCVVYKGVDVIVFEVFGNDDQCTKSPMGIYYTPVPKYMQGWLDQIAQKMEDQEVDDYVQPEAADYQYCTPKEVNGEVYNLMLGCADDTTQSIAVNVYSDDQCSKKLKYGGYTDDANIDISQIEVPFKKCQACVNWVNKNDDQIDDQFYVKRQMQAPLCSTAWEYKETCNRKCRTVGLASEREGWNSSDLILLMLMLAFGAVMLAVIWNTRKKMSPKNALAEQAILASAGLQQIHIAITGGVLLLIILVSVIFGLKNLAFSLLLIIDITLFVYQLKLTFDSSEPPEEVIGPDGQILQRTGSDDSEAESCESSVRPQQGTYMLPTLA
mmetsp:Transcript_24336/g.67432  ORF Transcript_24336/g.67432 Transcript_24336/m.67432 type:complete len:412 (-) Transcript_24336:106-1341(-)